MFRRNNTVRRLHRHSPDANHENDLNCLEDTHVKEKQFSRAKFVRLKKVFFIVIVIVGIISTSFIVRDSPHTTTAGTMMWNAYIREAAAASASLQPDVFVHGKLVETYTKAPQNVSKTVFFKHWTYATSARHAFIEVHGWKEVSRCEDAHICHGCPLFAPKIRKKARSHFNGLQDTDNMRPKPYLGEPWQRCGLIPGIEVWESKHAFVAGLRDYYHKQHQKLHLQPRQNRTLLSSSTEVKIPTMKTFLYFLPETYLLKFEDDQNAFNNRLYKNGGMNRPWVLKNPELNKGRGVEILGANSHKLQTVVERIKNYSNTGDTSKLAHLESGASKSEKSQKKSRRKNSLVSKKKKSTKKGWRKRRRERKKIRSDYIIQEYICNELVWFNGQKFDLRFYWFVLSVDPPIVLFHNGFARVSRLQYQETNFATTDIHLTNHRNCDYSDPNVTAEHLWRLIRRHHKENYDTLSKRLPTIHTDPVAHVRNQMKEAVGILSKAFLSGNIKAFNESTPSNEARTENLFGGLYGCDFIIDNDLDVYFIEAQNGPGTSEGIPWREKVNDDLFLPIPKLLEELIVKQEENAKANILPLKNLGAYDIVRAGDWYFQYSGYNRNYVDKSSCNNANT